MKTANAAPFDRDHTWGFRRYQFLSFMMLGIVNPWLAPLFEDRGMTEAQVGWLTALFSVTALLVPPVWGMVSDASRDRRRVLLAAIVTAAVSFATYHVCHSLAALVVVTLLFGASFKAIIPLGIGLTFAYVEPAGKDYSRIRLFGTAGYIAALLLMAVPLHFWPRDVIFPCFAVFAAAAALGLMSLPKIAGPPRPSRRKLDWRALSLLTQGPFAVTVLCTFVAQAAMGAHYFFFSQYMLNVRNVSQGNLTFFWAFGSVFEVIMLTQVGKLLRRFGVKWVLVAGLAGIALRLGIYAAIQIVPIIFVAQGLHAFTFGAVHASTVTFVNYAAPVKWRASAQTLFEGVTIGLGMAVGAVVGGYIAHTWDYPTLFACASAAAGLACVVYAFFGRSATLAPRRARGPEHGRRAPRRVGEGT